LHCSPNIVNVIRSRPECAGNVTLIGDMRKAYKIFVAKPEEKRPFRRTRHRYNDNINTEL